MIGKPNDIALVALGGNLPRAGVGPLETLQAAFVALTARGASIRAVSRFFATPCFPAGAGPDYVNAAVALDWAEAPEAILGHLHGIEADFGRTRQVRWGGRTLDLDLLAVGNRVVPDAATWEAWRALPPGDQTRIAPDRLILPHPRLHERAFVLVPLGDIAADWCHPVLGLSVAAMIAALPSHQRAEVRAL